MKNATRLKFNAVTASIAQVNEVPSATESFNVTPSIAQKMVDKIQESSGFLKLINIIPVDEMSGEALALNSAQSIAKRTNTKTGAKRNPTDPTGLESNTYQLKKTDFDVALRYEKLDAWAKFKDFYARWQAFVNSAIALDLIKIGFNGTSAAEDTDIIANPLLQDVNIGWLEKIRTVAPSHHMKEVVAASNQVTIGTDGDYKNLDAMVQDAVSNLIDDVHQDATDLVVICGRTLLNDKNFAITSDASDNTNVLAGQVLIGQKQIGGLPAVRVPFFPDDAMLITSLNNLSIYYQESGKRRHIKDEPESDRVAEYQSSNDAYVVEDYGKTAFIENITIL